MLCHGQDVSMDLSSDIGTDQLSGGIYVKPAAHASFFKADYAASMGVQWTFSQAERKVFSGWQAAAGKEFQVREFPLSVSLITIINPYSDLVREMNFGFLLGHYRDHLFVRLGNASRIYALKKKAYAPAGGDTDPSFSIIEYRNFIYQMVAYLHPMEKSWNMGAGISNLDNFRVQQETNPMFVITGYSRIQPGLNINADLWFQGAGMSNLSADFYGFYGRIGLTWTPGTE